MTSIIDTVGRRGKRKDAMVGCPASFAAGTRVQFGRYDKKAKPSFTYLGSATVEQVDLSTKVVKFDALPANVKPGDFIMLASSTIPNLPYYQTDNPIPGLERERA